MYTLKQYTLVPNFAIVALVLLAGSTLHIGCQPCNRTGMSISVEAKQTSITAPPGGGSRSFIRVRGSNFAPNSPMTLSFRNYPAANTAYEQFNEATSTDGGGNFNWEKDLFQLTQRNFSSEPNVDVWITAKETNSGCSAMTSIKTHMILNPPFK